MDRCVFCGWPVRFRIVLGTKLTGFCHDCAAEVAQAVESSEAKKPAEGQIFLGNARHYVPPPPKKKGSKVKAEPPQAAASPQTTEAA